MTDKSFSIDKFLYVKISIRLSIRLFELSETMPNETKIAKRQREWEEIEDDRKRQKSSSTYDPENYANRNSFTHGYHFETASNPVIGEGECKTVRKGTYDGDRGECVGKALKDGLEGGSLGDDVKAAEKSLAYLAGFHKHIAENLPQLAGQVSIKMNVPEVRGCNTFVYW